MKKLAKILMYIIGFIIYVVCLSKLHDISNIAYMLGIGASFGAILFTLSANIKPRWKFMFLEKVVIIW